MTSFASWTLPLQHPYLSRPSLKRKHSYYSLDSSSETSPTSAASDLPPSNTFPFPNNNASSDAYPGRLTKRLRCETLERDLEQLHLEQQQQMELEKRRDEQDKVERLWQRDGEVDMSNDDVIRPSSIESPPDVPVATMHSWYEPEKDRIIITSLDTDSETNSPVVFAPEIAADPNDQLVSKVILQSLRDPSSLSSSTLVQAPLFDPGRWGDLTALERWSAGMGTHSQTDSFAGYSDLANQKDMFVDDAMDVE